MRKTSLISSRGSRVFIYGRVILSRRAGKRVVSNSMLFVSFRFCLCQGKPSQVTGPSRLARQDKSRTRSCKPTETGRLGDTTISCKRE